MAEFEAEPDGSFLLIENHCPICAAAKICQGFCRSELELFRAAFGAGTSVMRQEHLLSNGGRCVYRVTSLEGTDSRAFQNRFPARSSRLAGRPVRVKVRPMLPLSPGQPSSG
jgi:hypothetical protein